MAKKKHKETMDSSSRVQPPSTDDPRQTENCPAEIGQKPAHCLWNGRYPGEYAPSCGPCSREDECRKAIEGVSFLDLEPENESNFFKDVLLIEAHDLLECRYAQTVWELTETPVGNYIPVPDELRRSVSDLVIKRYLDYWQSIIQSQCGSTWNAHRHASFIAAAHAYKEISEKVDKYIHYCEKDILHDIATVALSTFDVPDEGYDEE